MRRRLIAFGSFVACFATLTAAPVTRAASPASATTSTTGSAPANSSVPSRPTTPTAEAAPSHATEAEPASTESGASPDAPALEATSDAAITEASRLKRAQQIVKEVDEVLARMKAAADTALPHEIAVGRRQMTALQEEAKTLEQTEKLRGISRMPLVGLIIAYAYECNNLAAVTEMTTAYDREREALLDGWDVADPALPRKWRSVNGSVAEGVLISYDRDFVLVRRTNGKLAKAPRATLSKEDNDFLDTLPEMSPAETSAADNPASPESSDIQQTNPVAVRVQELERSRID